MQLGKKEAGSGEDTRSDHIPDHNIGQGEITQFSFQEGFHVYPRKLFGYLITD
jgi:hypothetical protein